MGPLAGGPRLRNLLRAVLILVSAGAATLYAMCAPIRPEKRAAFTDLCRLMDNAGIQGVPTRLADYFLLHRIPFSSGQNSFMRLVPALTPTPAVPHSKMDPALRNSRGLHNVAMAQLP